MQRLKELLSVLVTHGTCLIPGRSFCTFTGMDLPSRTFKATSAFAFEKVVFTLLYTAMWKFSVVQANRALTQGESPAESRKFYRRLLRNLTRHVAQIIFHFGDFKKLPKDTADYPFHPSHDRNTYELAPGSAPVLEKMREGGIFLTAHFGNYEAIGPWLCRLGIPLKASYIPLKPAWLNRFVEGRLRSVDGESYSVNARTPREFLRLLDEHKLFCLLADQDSRIPSAQAGTFLGHEVHMNPLPDFLLKHRPGTPVYICWMEELHDKKILHAEEFPTAPGKKIMDTYNRWLENRIAEKASLWYGWTHRRFLGSMPEAYSNLE